MSSSNEILAIGINTKPLILFRNEYNVWKGRFMDFIEHNEKYGEMMKDNILNGDAIFEKIIEAVPDNNPPIAAERRRKLPSELTAEERDRVRADKDAK